MLKKTGNGPLLYINQSFSPAPFQHKMQEIFTSKEMQPSIPVELPSERKREHVQPITAELEEKTIEKNQSEPLMKPVKTFQEMNINEKIDYLLQIPKVLPPIPCVFYTKHENFQGYLNQFENNQVTIQFHNKATKEIPIDEISNIMMIGLKK
ncbi:CotO family spore coat protein [Bacillus rubiinfantis]|uniref:CotO family spore coat protein n=1 Tax=Bacillus rubiinfantis TaxID=1499680 RepID=UPI0005A80FB2|nr:CotO family spore coat protein [Bacillus rubiinfantis]